MWEDRYGPQQRWYFTTDKAKGNLANKIFIGLFICATLYMNVYTRVQSVAGAQNGSQRALSSPIVATSLVIITLEEPQLPPPPMVIITATKNSEVQTQQPPLLPPSLAPWAVAQGVVAPEVLYQWCLPAETRRSLQGRFGEQ